MSAPPPLADPLPPRLRWFAPWRWQRRNRCVALAVFLLVTYVMSPAPVCVAVETSVLSNYAWPTFTIEIFYFPIFWCWDHSELVRGFYVPQYEFLRGYE
jgi:hypothetical protein